MTAGLIILFVVLFVISILMNGFFAGYETGFVSANPIRVQHRADKEGYVHAKRLLTYMDRPDRLLTVVLLGTNVTLMMGTIALTRLAGGFWAMVIATPMFLIFGEIVPKSMFRIHPTRLSLALLPAIRFFDVLFLPVARPVAWLSQRLFRLRRGKDEQLTVRMLMRCSEDMRVLVDESADHGTIEPEEKEMIHNVMDLQTQQANEVMVPRIDIQALPETATRAELVTLLQESGRTRIPIYRDNIDTVVGVVNAFDVICDTTPDREDIQRFVKDVMHVPDTMKLDDVLKAMRDARQSMAIVIDEYGGTDGLVTIEDILEEIFGEIHDEYDREETSIRRVGPQDYIVDARTPLGDASDAMGITVTDEEVETVGGWLMRLAARIPQKGEVMVFGRFRITVIEGGPNHVSSIRIEVLPGEEERHEQEP